MPYAAASPPRLFTLVLLAGLTVLSLNMFLPSLSNMAADFQVDYSIISLSIAGYLAITAVLQLVMGPLSDRFGRRPVLLVALAIFTVASLVCTLTTDIRVFLGFRVLQGAIIAGWALSLAVIRDTAPPQEAASLIGYVSMAMAVSPMLGPMLGGALDELFGWRASFVTFFVLGLAMLALCWVDLGETNAAPSATFAEQFATYPEVLRSSRFWGYAVCMAFSTGTFYTFLAGAPLVATTLYDMSPAMLGFCMGTITAGFMLGSFLSGRFARRYALTTMMIAGRIVACVGLLAGLGLVMAGVTHVSLLFGSTAFVGVGNGLTMPSSHAGVLSVRPQLAGSASGLSGALTVGGGAALTPLTAAILTDANGAHALLAIMLASTAIALLAALFVLRTDRRDR
jgi:Bcr/CflA subfamily drug resistance transporter